MFDEKYRKISTPSKNINARSGGEGPLKISYIFWDIGKMAKNSFSWFIHNHITKSFWKFPDISGDQEGIRKKSQERMIHFPKLAQNHTHHQIFSIFWIFSTQIFDTHPYFFHFFPIFIRNLRTPPNFFPVIRLTLVKYITECLLSISY